MKAKPLPSQEFLLSILRYDGETGFLYWRARPATMFRSSGRGGAEANAKRWNAEFAGERAFHSLSSNGRYYKGAINGRTLLAHRVIFKMLHGFEPPEIDHDSRDGLDNRERNLVAATTSQNHRNRKTPSTNTSGIVGVCWAAHNRKWLAFIRGAGRKTIHLGYFMDMQDAAIARRAAAKALGYHPNHGRAA